MPRRIANSTLNASTIDIMNVIRQNASYDYQQNVPVVQNATDIPRVGEVIYGTPAFANQFLNALVNRIAIVRMQSATFNNPYSMLKKGIWNSVKQWKTFLFPSLRQWTFLLRKQVEENLKEPCRMYGQHFM